MDQFFEGGCFCGHIRYRGRGPVVDAGYCHCRMCQRMAAAPVVPWAELPAAAFAYQSEEPAVLKTSEWGERRFCPHCGTYLDFRRTDEPKGISINTVTLDEPSLAPPRKHIFYESRVSWFEVKDELPRFIGYGDEKAS